MGTGNLFLILKRAMGLTKLTPLSQQGFIIYWCIDIHFQRGQRWRIHCYSVE